MDVERQITHHELRGRRSQRGSANQCLDPGQHFGEGKGLGQVIVPARSKTLDPLVERALCAQDENRDVNSGVAQGFDDGQTVHLGQHQVDDRGVVRFRHRQVQAVLPIGGVIHGKTVLREPGLEKAGDFPVVFDNQYPHGTTPSMRFRSRRQ
jgi:hypothetical protein